MEKRDTVVANSGQASEARSPRDTPRVPVPPRNEMCRLVLMCHGWRHQRLNRLAELEWLDARRAPGRGFIGAPHSQRQMKFNQSLGI